MRFELIINLQIAKSLGLVATASIMLRADEVIERGAALLRLLTAGFGTEQRSLGLKFTTAIGGAADLP
jgi:hypothetical protein